MPLSTGSAGFVGVTMLLCVVVDVVVAVEVDDNEVAVDVVCADKVEGGAMMFSEGDAFCLAAASMRACTYTMKR